MCKLFLVVISLGILHVSTFACAQDKASDFFKNLSKEKNLLNALYSKSRKNPVKDAKLKPFTLAGEGGLLSSSGNTNASIIKIALESNHEMTNWSNQYETQYLQRVNTVRNDNGKQKIRTARFEVSAQFDYKLLDPNNRMFGYIEYDNNEFNRLSDQATAVFGWSQVVWKEKKSEFRYSIGPGYSHLYQERNKRRIEEMIIRGTIFYNLEFGGNARFRQTISAEVGEEITKARSQSSITAKIFEKLALKFTINLVVNDNVADEDSILSTQTSISMVYQFF